MKQTNVLNVLKKTMQALCCILSLSTAALAAEPPPAAPGKAEPASAQTGSRDLGNVTKVETHGRETLIKCQNAVVRVNFWSDRVLRMQVSQDASFSNFDDAKAFMIQPGLATFKGSIPKATETGDALTLVTESVVMEVSKKPFRFRFLRPGGKNLLAEGTFETGVRASFRQDACGQEEHYFGLQNEHDDTLDQRGRVVCTLDKNGAGWSAPFVMSTAGYGLFLNNEESAKTFFTLKQPVVIENSEAKGPMDLFFIAGGDLKQILNTYMEITGKPGMPPRKLLGFQYLVQGTPIDNEEAFPEWIKRGYPIDSCITFTDHQVEEPSEIEAVAGTAQRIHKLNGLFGFYFDVYKMPGTFRKTRPEPVNRPYEGWDNFKEMVKSRLLDNGVDWFWTDETDMGQPPRFQHNLYTALKEVQEAQDNRRSFNCARGGYAGAQRFGYPWMGDVHYTRRMLISNLCNGVSGFPHSTHDMSGASLNTLTEQTFLNGVKCNLFNPLSQCNAWVRWNKKSHRPWDWSPDAEGVFKKFLDLHYQMIPYFYTTAWQSHKSGLPAWRALALDYPDDQTAYSSDEVLVGDWLLMAPLYKESARNVYLPEGKWYYLFDSHMSFTGPTVLGGVQPPHDEYPVFIKAGAVIPMMPTMRYVGEKPVDPLTLLIYPLESGTSSYNLYEDDGITRDYEKGDYCTTRIECQGSVAQVRISVGERDGRYKPSKRALMLSVFQAAQAKQVELNGKNLRQFETREQLDAAEEGWGFFQDTLTGVKRVFVKTVDEGRQSQVSIARGAANASSEKPKLTPTFDNDSSKRYDKIKDIPSKVSFLKEDRSTSGNWKGSYGKNGYLLPGIGKKAPDQTDIQTTGMLVFWERNTADVRALQRETGEDRTAARFQETEITVEILSEDTRPRKITLYLLDWEDNTDPRKNRTTEVSARNPMTNTPYDVRNVESFHDGVYLTYEVSGSVIFKLYRVKGSTAVISGVFFD